MKLRHSAYNQSSIYKGWIKSTGNSAVTWRWWVWELPALWTLTRTVTWVSAASGDSTLINLLQCVGIVRALYDYVYKTRGTFLDQNWSGTMSYYTRMSSGTAWSTCWHRISSFFITMQGATPLLLSRTSCAAGNARFWNTHRTNPMSLCDYDLVAKANEPLRGTRYNTRDELIRAIGRSIRNVDKGERADGLRHLPNIWKKGENKESDYIEGV